MTDSVFLHVHVTAGRHINMFYCKKRKLTFLVVFEKHLWEIGWSIKLSNSGKSLV